MREIHILSYADFSICPKPLTHPTQGLGGLARVNLLLPSQELNSDFFKSPKILRARFRCMTSFISLVISSLWDFYFDISEWHILTGCAWTPALMLHLTNICAKRMVLSLTKPKGKIYKTKSLGHYITDSVKSVTLKKISSRKDLNLWIPKFPIFFVVCFRLLLLLEN